MVLAADGEVLCGTRTSMGAAGLGPFEGACVWTEFSLSGTRGRGEVDPGDESDTLALFKLFFIWAGLSSGLFRKEGRTQPKTPEK